MTVLREQAATGVRWTATAHATRQAMQFGAIAVLAHFVTPGEFGIVAMALVFVAFVGLLRDLGTGAALVQGEAISPAAVTSVFWLNVVVGLTAGVALHAIGPLAARLFDEPQVSGILRELAIVAPLVAIGTVPRALLQRAMRFRALAWCEMSAIGAGSVLAIAAGVSGAGARSLVVQQVVIALVTTVLAWIVSDWRPSGRPSWRHLARFRGFSLNLTAFNVMNYFIRHADNVIIGAALGPVSLGYYTLAYRLFLVPLQGVAAVLSRVLLPVYSRLQADHERCRRIFLRTVAMVALVCFPVMTGLLVCAGTIVPTVFGPAWTPVVPLIMVLAPVGLIQSVCSTVGPVYVAKGRTGLMLAWGLAAGVLFIGAFLIGVRNGLVGVAVAYAIVNALLVYPSLAIPLRLIGLPLRQVAEAVARPLACSLIMAAGVALVSVALPAGLATSLALTVQVTCGIALYLTATRIWNGHALRELIDMAAPIRPTLAGTARS